jgi:hypothetical protein
MKNVFLRRILNVFVLSAFLLICTSALPGVHVVCESSNCFGPCDCRGDSWSVTGPCSFNCTSEHGVESCDFWGSNYCLSRDI